MSLSNMLVEEISRWPIVEMPQRMFHGCRDDDIGIDIENSKIKGNKWCSIEAGYAGDYAWSHTRNHNATPYLLELTVNKPLKGIHRPAGLNGESWPPFLKKCFPECSGYELSKRFERSIVEHIIAAFGVHVNGYVSYDGGEVIVTNSERFLLLKSYKKLPSEKADYLKIRDSIYA